jgi:trehalose/maltose hydrolase-like predicted phosphorylase
VAGVLAAATSLDLTNTRGLRWVASRQAPAEGRHALRLRTLVPETEALAPYDVELAQALRPGRGAAAGQSDDRIWLATKTDAAPAEPVRLLLLTTCRSSRRGPLPAAHDFAALDAACELGLARLLAEHEAAWRELWRARVEVDGDPAVQAAADAALWNLVSSLRAGGDDSISPMGLSKVDTNHYGGHVFWDAETWMFPPLLLLHRELARSMLEYRFTRLEGARQNAILKGATEGTPWHSEAAWFPWESARTGQEACPRWFVAGDEIHNNACIALAFWQFAQVHGDAEFVRTRAAPVTSGIARFYAARARQEADGRHHLRGVTGADEYAERKDDFPYVNGSARRALEIAGAFARATGTAPPPEWAQVAAGLVVPFDAERGIHPEYEGYDGRTIKQADVVLMSYPWRIVTEPARVRADLEFYEPRTAENAPAMSAAIHAILWAQLGEPERALAAFGKAWRPNVKGPFLAWSETPRNDCISFTTGMGGFLQALVNGFGGIRVVEGGLEARPFLPPGWSALRVRGITLGAGTVDLVVERDGVRLEPASGKPDLGRFRIVGR